MRKITGKALATVLAMALITSSFSGTFAFAASKTEKAGSASFTGGGKYSNFDSEDEITLVKDPKNQNTNLFDLKELIGGMTLTTADKAEKDVEVETDDLSFRHAKGDSLLSINKDGEAKVKSDKTGTETIMVYGEATITRDDKDITLKGQKEITIHVVKNGTLFVGIKGVPEGKAGKQVPSLDISFNDQSWKDVAVYEAYAGDGLVANYQVTDINGDGDDLRVEAPSNNRFEVLTKRDVAKLEGTPDAELAAIDNEAVVAIRNVGKSYGTMKLNIKSKSKDKFNTTEDSTTASIQKKIDIFGAVSVEKNNSKTTIGGDGVKTSVEYDKDGNASKPVYATGEKAEQVEFWGDMDGVNVSGYDINVLASAAGTGEAKKMVIGLGENVSVGAITSDKPAGVTVSVTTTEKTKVGDISDVTDVSISEGATAGAIDILGDFDMTEGRVTSVEADGAIEIKGGTVSGNITNDSDDGVTINAEDDDINTVISGTIEAKKLKVEKDSDDAKIQIANVVLKDDGELTLSDSGIEIGKLDCAYEGAVNFESFEGKLPSIVNAGDVTVDEDSTVVVEGASNMDTLDIAEDGSIEFKDSVTVESLSGDGKLIVPAGKLHITDGVSGSVKLRLAGANVNVGDVAFTAAKDAADVDSFEGIGFKMEKKSVDKDTDSFLVKSVSFAGVALDKSEVTIAKGFSNTVTVSNYPASTSLPTGASVVWDFSDADKDIFDITADGATLNIAVKDYDDVYATSNSFDLYATVVDKDGDALEDYDSAKCTVNAIKEVPVSSDLSGIVEVPQGSTKDFVVNSSIEAPVTIGTADVAVHAVKTPFANAQATYTIKATGAVGTTAGVYATVPGQVATKLFVIKVTAPVVTSDTTVDFDLTAGSRYVFKITAPAAPSFTVGNGDVLKTQAGKIDGNDYYFAVYAQNVAGQSTGVYVNGVKVCTVTVK
ncbi:hypothetical protein [Clostridium sp. D33t1_170424_F3]|uniref:hypothetical protein n=1 Tax=Clostridium sp. D33t1_170424_F3 TaxID=2787099 RepID=UPI0018ABC58C|nr:hypothetical protein [Clostridium sp. D33t1_170424_F3]